MSTKKEQAELKRNQIVQVSLELFFTKGYEKTSIRDIQNKVGSTASLFYHYFDSKDKVFEEAIKLFFQSYEMKMNEIIASSKVNVVGLLDRYLLYVCGATKEFRNKYLGKLHWTILSAIREYTLMIMRKYILEILTIYQEEKMINFSPDRLNILANLIAFSVGGSILYQDMEIYLKQKKDIYNEIKILLNVDEI